MSNLGSSNPVDVPATKTPGLIVHPRMDYETRREYTTPDLNLENEFQIEFQDDDSDDDDELLYAP